MPKMKYYKFKPKDALTQDEINGLVVEIFKTKMVSEQFLKVIPESLVEDFEEIKEPSTLEIVIKNIKEFF